MRNPEAKTTQIFIDTDLGIEYQDAGPWRSYHLVAQGATYQELLDDAVIAEVDQDGGDLRYYGLRDEYGDDEAKSVALRVIRQRVGV